MASVIVRFRAGWAVGNMFEYPVWLVTGLLIPVALLPGWVEPISWVLAPTWGMRALSDAAFAGGSPFVDIAMCLAAQRRLHRARRAAARPLPRVGAPARDPLADVSALRVALIGGLLSFRGLFNWLHPALFVPTLIVPPLFQVLFFAYLGRAAELESDTFYVVGNSIQLAALPGLFAMSQAIAGERRAQTLPHLLASPASRRGALPRPQPARDGARRRRLAHELRVRSAPARRRARGRLAAAARADDGDGGVLVHRARDRARRGRAARARAGRLLQPRLRRAARLLRRQRPARRPAGLDEHGRAGAAGDARGRGGSRGRRRRERSRTWPACWRRSWRSARAFLVLGLALLRYYEHVARRRATLELT